MSDRILITPTTYRAQRMHRALADQVMKAHSLDPNYVWQIELTEADAVVWSYTNPRTVAYWSAHGSIMVSIRRRYPHGGTA